MIEVKNLVKDYGKVLGADHISLSDPPGQLTVLLGANGAGKSTTIKSIIGLLKFKGEVTICGHDNLSVEAKRLFAYIPETPVLFELLTIQEHIDYIGNAYNLPNYQETAAYYLKSFHLDHKRKTIAKELSKGMRQKVSMILALMTEPKALLVDEPMMGLDPTSIQETLNILASLKEKGTSILLSTHIIDMVDDIWDRAYILKEGKVVAETIKASQSEPLKELFFRVNQSHIEQQEGAFKTDELID